jgi:hypothetical protein
LAPALAGITNSNMQSHSAKEKLKSFANE